MVTTGELKVVSTAYCSQPLLRATQRLPAKVGQGKDIQPSARGSPVRAHVEREGGTHAVRRGLLLQALALRPWIGFGSRDLKGRWASETTVDRSGRIQPWGRSPE